MAAILRKQVIKSLMWRAVNLEGATPSDLILKALDERQDDEYLDCAFDMAAVAEHCIENNDEPAFILR